MADQRKWKYWFDLISTSVISVAAIVLVSTVAIQNWPRAEPAVEVPTIPARPISIVGAAAKGNAAAKVVLIEYADFQCPTCGKFAREVLPAIDSKYVDSGKVLRVYRHLPLTGIHKKAFRAAAATVCAGQQGRFWQMHDALYQEQGKFDPADLESTARKLGVGVPAFTACLESDAAGAQVRADAGTAVELGLDATPTLFVGHLQPEGTVKVVKHIRGGMSVADLSRLLDELLAQAASGL